MRFSIRPKAAPPAPPRAQASVRRAEPAVRQSPASKAREASAWEPTGGSAAAPQLFRSLAPRGTGNGGVVRGDGARGGQDSSEGAQMARDEPLHPGRVDLGGLRKKVGDALKDLLARLQEQVRGSDPGAGGSDSRSAQPTAQGNDPAVVAAFSGGDGTQTSAITPPLEKRISNGGNLGESLSVPPGKDQPTVSAADFDLIPKALGEFLAEQQAQDSTKPGDLKAKKLGENSGESTSSGPVRDGETA